MSTRNNQVLHFAHCADLSPLVISGFVLMQCKAAEAAFQKVPVQTSVCLLSELFPLQTQRKAPLSEVLYIQTQGYFIMSSARLEG